MTTKLSFKVEDATVIIDAEDFDKVKNLPWTLGHNKYVEYKYGLNGRTIVVRLHRLLLGHTDTSYDIDHIDGFIYNNSKDNLRVATRQQNSYNKPKYYGTSRYKGVYKNNKTGKWTASIHHNYHAYYLLAHENDSICGYAYNIAAKLLAKEFAYENKILEEITDELKLRIEARVQYKIGHLL